MVSCVRNEKPEEKGAASRSPRMTETIFRFIPAKTPLCFRGASWGR
jgi:hypothetical protein